MGQYGQRRLVQLADLRPAMERGACVAQRGDVMGTTKIVMGTTRMVKGTILKYCTKLYFWFSGVGYKIALTSSLVSED